MMIPGEYHPRSRARSAQPGEALEGRHEQPAGAGGTKGRAPVTSPREWPVWARIAVPLTVTFLVMFVAMWITSLAR